MEKLTLEAKLENLDKAVDFINQQAQLQGFDKKKINQIQLASEELLVNIINYAYPDKKGKFEITCSTKESKGLEVKIVDWGIAFNPLELPEPDTKAPLEERKIGGLGIYLVRNTMDETNYTRTGDSNIFTFVKY
ncbi:MAG: ATP-binding protein [Candidatus Omnitrophica bacterium]|nr:ATP-binding protein [Candidatus Omnitrophota bacterium]